MPVFQQHDLVTDKIPEQFDLILSRHTMIHLYNADVLQVLKNFQDSGSRSDTRIPLTDHFLTPCIQVPPDDYTQ